MCASRMNQCRRPSLFRILRVFPCDRLAKLPISSRFDGETSGRVKNSSVNEPDESLVDFHQKATLVSGPLRHLGTIGDNSSQRCRNPTPIRPRSCCRCCPKWRKHRLSSLPHDPRRRCLLQSQHVINRVVYERPISSKSRIITAIWARFAASATSVKSLRKASVEFPVLAGAG